MSGGMCCRRAVCQRHSERATSPSLRECCIDPRVQVAASDQPASAELAGLDLSFVDEPPHCCGGASQLCRDFIDREECLLPCCRLCHSVPPFWMYLPCPIQIPQNRHKWLSPSDLVCYAVLRNVATESPELFDDDVEERYADSVGERRKARGCSQERLAEMMMRHGLRDATALTV